MTRLNHDTVDALQMETIASVATRKLAPKNASVEFMRKKWSGELVVMAF